MEELLESHGAVDPKNLKLPYDTYETFLFKIAVKVFSVPVRLMIVRKKTQKDQGGFEDSNYIYDTLESFMRRSIKEDKIQRLYKKIIAYNALISPNDFIMTYYKIQGDKATLEEINRLYSDLNNLSINKYSHLDSFLRDYNSWNRDIQKELSNDSNYLEGVISKNQEELGEQYKEEQNIYLSSVSVNTVVKFFSPLIANGKTNKKVKKEDGLEIFDKSRATQYVPFIRYNDEYGKSYYKVYMDKRSGKLPDYSNIVLSGDSFSIKNTIFTTLWLGDPKDDGTEKIFQAPRESFFVVVYNLANNLLSIETPSKNSNRKRLITDERIAFRRVQEAFPMIILGKERGNRFYGGFNIWNVDYDETSLIHQVLTDSLLNLYLFLDESTKPFAFKLKLELKYNPLFLLKDHSEDILSFVISKKYTVNKLEVEVLEPRNISKVIISKDTSYIHVKIKNADSYERMIEFAKIFYSLIKYHNKIKDSILNLYKDLGFNGGILNILIPTKKRKTKEQEPSIFDITKRTIVTKRENDNIQKLRKLLPDVFLGNYPRKCQKSSQPHIMTIEEYNSWKESEGKNYEGQVLFFPKDNPVIAYICLGKDYRYPGLKKVKDPIDKERVHYIPCCFKKDQILWKKSNYNKYTKDIYHSTFGAKADNKLTTRKVLEPGKMAFLPRSIQNIISRAGNFNEILRYGVIFSPNSFLHCVFTALEYKGYLLAENKEEYVVKFRKSINQYVHLEVLKQELYDYNLEEINAIINDEKIFFDPALFYRCIEEIFNINVYVFGTLPPNTLEVDYGVMDVPRHKIFHVRPLRSNRKTMLILKNWGSESDYLKYPQCELIIDHDPKTHDLKILFERNVTVICHEVLEKTLQTVTWFSKPNNKIQAYDNLYYKVDLTEENLKPVSQYIDDHGKMRAITFEKDSNLITIIPSVPCQPKNLRGDKSIKRADVQTLISIFSKDRILSITKDRETGWIDGVWYKSSTNQEVYVPIQPINIKSEYPIGPSNPIFTQGNFIVDKLIKLRRKLNIIIQLIQWLYDFLFLEFRDNALEKFKELVNITNQPENYDISKVPKRLPDVKSHKEVLEHLKIFIPTLVNNDNKLTFHNTIFAERIYEMLKVYEPHLDLGVKIKKEIKDYYFTEQDFTMSKDSLVFLKKQDLETWISSLKVTKHEEYFRIHEKINKNLSNYLNPYIYKDKDNKFYIVQNVVNGEKEKAMIVSYYWVKNKINIGSDPKFTINKTYHCRVYGISPDFFLRLIETIPGEENIIANILYYGTKIEEEKPYAALLELQ